jgi:hypothetical protein
MNKLSGADQVRVIAARQLGVDLTIIAQIS